MGAEGLSLVLMVSDFLDVVPPTRVPALPDSGNKCGSRAGEFACALQGTYLISIDVNRLVI
jgi:hypothetical protein